MANERSSDLVVSIEDGPDRAQLMWSLLRCPSRNRYAVDATIVSAVLFPVNVEQYKDLGAERFFASIDMMGRMGPVGCEWKLEGRVIDPPGFTTFSGTYDTRLRAGTATLVRA